jgi:hypothetical protein
MATSASTDRPSTRIPANSQVTLPLESQDRQTRQKVQTIDLSSLGVRIRPFGALVPGQTAIVIPSEDSSKVNPCRVEWGQPVVPSAVQRSGA